MKERFTIATHISGEYKPLIIDNLTGEQVTEMEMNQIIWSMEKEENMLDKWLEEYGDEEIYKYQELKLAIIDIIGFGMEPERAELKAEELIKLFEEHYGKEIKF
jgi:hypothetical protein